ncbi:MAG: histidine kinase [Putridiphycobacter sp.]
MFFKNYNVRDGLPSNSIYDILEDQDGFIWLSTDVGVTRFDGYTFKSFNQKDGLMSNEILKMYLDEQQRLWFLGFNGKISFYQNGMFYNHLNDQTLRKIETFRQTDPSLSFPVGICENGGDIYISYRRSQLIKIKANGDLEALSFDKQNYNLWSKDNTVWIMNAAGINKIINKEIKLVHPHQFNQHFCRSFSDRNEIVYGIEKQLFIFDYNQNKIVDSTRLDAIITNITKTDLQHYCVSTRSGYYEFDGNLKMVKSVNLKQNIVSKYFIDFEGNTWVTTLGNGLYFSPSNTVKHIGQEDGLSKNEISSLYLDSAGRIWCGLRNEINILDTTEHIQKIHFNKGLDEMSLQIKAMPNNEIWVIGKSGIHVIKNNQISRFPLRANDALIHDNFVYIIGQGLMKIPIRDFNKNLEPKGAPINFKGFFDYRIYDSRINCMVEKQNKLLLGGPDGIYEYNFGVDSVLKNNQYHLTDEITALAFDTSSGLTFVGTKSNGLFCFDEHFKRVNYSAQNGLPSNSILSIKIADNRIWIGTSLGSAYLPFSDKSTLPQKAVPYHNILGLPPFKTTQIIEGKNEIYVSTDDGLFLLPIPENRTQKNTKPRLILSHIQLNDSGATIEDLSDLNYQQNALQFSFVGISYKDYGKLTYKYRLVGNFEDWRTTHSTSINFDALAPGSYQFELFVTNKYGLKSDSISIPILIKPPYYQTTWFMSSIVLVSLLLVWGFIRNRIRKINHQYELDKLLLAQETEKLELEKNLLLAEQKVNALQMNPHFIFNSLNMIKGFYAENKVSEGNFYISKFSKLLREIIECNTQFISLDKELNILNLYLILIKKRYGDKFNYSINSQIPNSNQIGIPPMLIQPFVENAVIHGVSSLPNGLININITEENQQIIITVEDNGVGVMNAVKTKVSNSKSHGIKITKERLSLIQQLFNQPCGVKIEPGANDTGTKVSINVPKIKYESNNN